MYLKKLIETGQGVFNINDLRKIWRVDDPNYLKLIASRLNKKGEIKRIKRGVYVLSKDFDVFELANKLKSPSYISLESVLARSDVVFQDYGNTVFSVSDNTISKEAGGFVFKYSKISDDILYNSLGVELDGKVVVASAERALCDRIYLTPNCYFDNPSSLNPKRLEKISKIYNKRVQDEVKKIITRINA